MLEAILKLHRYRRLALVGAGGKTTLINRLVEALRKDKKILVTSTTKFLRPEETMVDFIDDHYQEDYDLQVPKEKGIYLLGQARTVDNRILGLQPEQIEALWSSFDLAIIECDYSMGRPLKGFREREPLIPDHADMTIGVLDIQALGLPIRAENIHHLDRFLSLTGGVLHSVVTLNHLVRIVEDEEGLFRKAQGKKVLFINKVEKDVDRTLAIRLTQQLNLERLDLVLMGSLIKDRYEVLHSRI